MRTGWFGTAKRRIALTVLVRKPFLPL